MEIAAEGFLASSYLRFPEKIVLLSPEKKTGDAANPIKGQNI